MLNAREEGGRNREENGEEGAKLEEKRGKSRKRGVNE